MSNSFATLFMNFFSRGQERTIRAKRNIGASVVIKGLSILTNLLLIPMTIHFVDATRYGIWITLSSIIAWFNFFDIGLGNGLRNRFAEAQARGQKELARTYISTCYVLLGIIVGVFLLAFSAVNRELNWAKILNTPASMAGELRILALIVAIFFGMQLILGLIITILTADQMPARASFIALLWNLVSLSAIFFLGRTSYRSLISLGIILSASPVVVLLAISFFYFRTRYRYFSPSLRHVDFKHARQLLGLGTKFFIIQVASLILFQTANIIISQLFGPQAVTPYNVAFRYFSAMIMAYGIIMAPFWSAFTEAYVKNDLTWIRSIIRKLNVLSFLFSGIIGIMVLASPFVFRLWVGASVRIPFVLSALMGLFAAISIVGTPYSTFLNGLGKIKLSLWIAIAGSSLNIPLAIFLAKHMSLGIAGVILSVCICNSPILIYGPLQYGKIIKNKAVGIWGR